LVNLIFLLFGTGSLLKRVSSCFPNSCLEFAGAKTSNINIRIFIGLQQTLFSRGGCTLPFLFWLASASSAEHQCNDPKESTSLTFLQHWPPNPPCCVTLPAYFSLLVFAFYNVLPYSGSSPRYRPWQTPVNSRVRSLARIARNI